MSSLSLYIFSGIIQILLAAWGAIVSVKALPSGKRQLPHIVAFAVMAILGVGLTVLIGLSNSVSEKEMRDKFDASRSSEEYMKGKLDTLVQLLSVEPGNVKLADAIKNITSSREAPPNPQSQLKTTINGLIREFRSFAASHNDEPPANPEGPQKKYQEEIARLFQNRFRDRLTKLSSDLSGMGFSYEAEQVTNLIMNTSNVVARGMITEWCIPQLAAIAAVL